MHRHLYPCHIPVILVPHVGTKTIVLIARPNFVLNSESKPSLPHIPQIRNSRTRNGGTVAFTAVTVVCVRCHKLGVRKSNNVAWSDGLKSSVFCACWYSLPLLFDSVVSIRWYLVAVIICTESRSCLKYFLHVVPDSSTLFACSHTSFRQTVLVIKLELKL